MEPSKTRNPALDGCRGIAILLVVAFHWFGAPFSDAYPHSFIVRVLDLGWCGVDLFFVLSGFLIGGILLDHLNSPNYFKTFYIRRAFRILPPYVLFIAAIELLVRIAGLGRTPWYSFLFTANFTFFLGTIWIGMQHLWSLAAEEQFYLILAPLLYWNRRVVPVIAVAAVVLSPIIRYFEWLKFGYLGARFLPFGHMDGLFAGVLIAYAIRAIPGFVRKVEPYLGWIAVSMVAILLVFARLGWTDRGLPVAVGSYALFVFLFGSLVAGAALSPDRWKWLQDPLLRRFGRYSYTIYLVHYPIFWLLAMKSYGLAVLVSASVSFTVAALSWRFYESRMIGFGHSFRYEAAGPGQGKPAIPEAASVPAD